MFFGIVERVLMMAFAIYRSVTKYLRTKIYILSYNSTTMLTAIFSSDIFGLAQSSTVSGYRTCTFRCAARLIVKFSGSALCLCRPFMIFLSPTMQDVGLKYGCALSLRTGTFPMPDSILNRAGATLRKMMPGTTKSSSSPEKKGSKDGSKKYATG